MNPTEINSMILSPPSRSRFSFALLLIILVALPGCDLLGDDDEGDPVTTGVYVANQGNFTEGTGAVTVYDPQSEETSTLSGFNSIVQSITLTNDRLYVMANTGPFVDAYALDGLTQVGQATDLVGPRYMAVAGNDKAYVTNQTFGQPSTVSVLDLSSMEVTKTIPVNGSADGIAVAAGRAYVAEGAFGAATTLAVIDTETDEVTDRVEAGCDSPRSVFADHEDDVWVVCTGVTTYDDAGHVTSRTNGAIRVLDGATGEITRRISVDRPLGAAGPGQDTFYSERAEEAYVVMSGNRLIRFNTAANERAATLGPLDGGTIGAVGYDAVNRHLYVGRLAPDNRFSARGTVTIHARSGERVDSFVAGIAPTYIAFASE